jgi:hypothetical protein
MRLDGATIGGGVGIAIVFGLVGAGVAHFWPCAQDGNPVGYNLVGKAVLKPGGFNLQSCTNGCTLTFNINTDQKNPVPLSLCNTVNCFHFKDNGDPKQLWQLKMKDADGSHGPFSDYVDGTVTITP